MAPTHAVKLYISWLIKEQACEWCWEDRKGGEEWVTVCCADVCTEFSSSQICQDGSAVGGEAFPTMKQCWLSECVPQVSGQQGKEKADESQIPCAVQEREWLGHNGLGTGTCQHLSWLTANAMEWQAREKVSLCSDSVNCVGSGTECVYGGWVMKNFLLASAWLVKVQFHRHAWVACVWRIKERMGVNT